MRNYLRFLAVSLIGVGIVWILQGINILPGSFMTGHIQWAYRGAACAAVGGMMLVFFRGKRSRG